MRNLLVVISCLFGIALAAPDARAQDISWAKRIGGANQDFGTSIAVDGSGNAYATGYFNETADFGSYGLTSAGGYDIFVAKLDSSGTVRWAKRMGGAADDTGHSIAVDDNGNVYVTGFFNGTADFGSYSLTPAGGYDIFVAKLDSSGTVLWAKRMGGAADDRSTSIAVDGSGNAYVTGHFNETADFGSYSLTSAGGYEIFVAKLDSSGTMLWAKRMGGVDFDRGMSIAIDDNGNAYVAGYFRGTADFGSYSLTSAGGNDTFVTKLDSGGTVLWATRMGGADFDFGTSIAIDDNGNAYVAGYFRGTAGFGSYSLTSAGGNDTFTTQLDSSGTVLWAKRMGGADFDFGTSIAVDDNGNAYVTGYFRGTADFGSYSLTSAGGDDTFVTKLDSSGTVLWAKRMGGADFDFGTSIAVDGNGNGLMTGRFFGTADFGSHSLTATGSYDVFVAKLAQHPDLLFTNKDTLSWSPLFGEVEWNIYWSVTSLPGTFFCLEDHQAVPEMIDFEEPAAGTLFAYLVTTINAAGQEGSLGYQAVDANPPLIERPNTNPCP